MATTMSLALASAGLMTQEAAEAAKPDNPVVEEIERIGELLAKKGIQLTLADKLMMTAILVRRLHGASVHEVQCDLLQHMRSIAAKHGLA